MNPHPQTSTIPTGPLEAWIALPHAQTEYAVIVIGAPRGRLNEFFPRIPSEEFLAFNGSFPTWSPTTLTIVLGQGFHLIDPSIQKSVSTLVTSLPSVTNVDVSVHESIWSKPFAKQLPVLPPNIRQALVSVSDFRVHGSVLFRVKFDSNASPFTTTFSCSLPGFVVDFKGHLKDFAFMLQLHRGLASVDILEGTSMKMEISRRGSITLNLSGKMGNSQMILDTVVKTSLSSPLFTQQTYHVESLHVYSQKLYALHEFGMFLEHVVRVAPLLRDLTIRIAELHPNETMEWTADIRVLEELRELRRVYVTHPLPLMLLDADVAKLLASWSKAESITLNPKPTYGPAFGQHVLSINVLEGIAPFIPESLRDFGVYLSTEHLPVLGFRSARPHYGLGTLKLGIHGFDYQRSEAVFRSAKALFPEARVEQV